MSIMIVDDDSDTRKILKELITQRTDHAVTAVANPGAGLDLVEQSEFKVVIADVDMPGMNGIEMLKELRSHHPHIRVIMISGKSSHDEVAEARQMGADGFYVKPMNLDMLLEHIEELHVK